MPGPDESAAPRVAVITGGGGDLARAIRSALAAGGCTVHAPPHTTLDVTDAAAVADWFARIPRVDLLVNNAGARRDAPLARLTEADWDHVHAVCLRGAFLCSRAALPRMGTGGHIVNIGSWSALAGVAGQAAYASAKAALLGFTHSLAAEVGPAGIRVNAVLPGWLDTAFTRDVPPAARERALTDHALGRFNTPDDAGRFLAFLDTMLHVSGQVFQLDSRIRQG